MTRFLRRDELRAIKTRSILRMGRLFESAVVREPVNGNSPLEALSHCPDCDVWLSPAQSCLHIPARDSARATDRRGVQTPPVRPPAAPSTHVHDSGDTHA